MFATTELHTSSFNFEVEQVQTVATIAVNETTEQRQVKLDLSVEGLKAYKKKYLAMAQDVKPEHRAQYYQAGLGLFNVHKQERR